MCKLVIGEGVFECFADGALGRVGDGFLKVDHLTSKEVKLGAFSIGIEEGLKVVTGSGNCEIVDVDGSVYEWVGIKALKKDSEEGVDRKDTEWAALE